jgi:hypothetical protein
MELPSDLMPDTRFIGNEYAWPIAIFPAALARAQQAGLACPGGQFQFRTPNSTCEMYWLNADSTDRAPDEHWDQYVIRSCNEVLAAFISLSTSTDFYAEASRWPAVLELLAAGAKPEQYLCFVAYFVNDCDT